MIAVLLRALALAARAHVAWPAQPLDRVAAAALAAARAERPDVPAELLLAIAEHESDLEPNAVSWRDASGNRVDILWSGDRSRLLRARAIVCGYVQASVGVQECAKAIERDGAMAIGARQLALWMRSPLCAGSLRCALAGYAGGVRGARAASEGSETLAVRFADLFLARARSLGMPAPSRRAARALPPS